MSTLHDRDSRRSFHLPRLRSESWRRASTFMLGVAAFFVLAGIGFGMLVASDYSTTWFDGLIAFLFLSPFVLFAGGVGLFLRYVIPRMSEGWYR